MHRFALEYVPSKILQFCEGTALYRRIRFSALDVGQGKICACKKQLIVPIDSESVTCAIAEIKRRRMSTFSETRVRVSPETGVHRSEWNDVDACSFDPRIQSGQAFLTTPTQQHNRGLQQRNTRHFARGFRNDLLESGPFRLVVQYSYHRRGVDDHLGSPSSS